MKTLLLTLALSFVASAANELEQRDVVSMFIDSQVAGRALVKTHLEPVTTDPKTGERTIREFARSASYSKSKKTENGLSFEYQITINWKSFKASEDSKPVGEAFNPESYVSKYQVSLISYPGHKNLYGVWHPVELTKNGERVDANPTHFQKVVVRLSDDQASLQIDAENLYPKISVLGDGSTTLKSWRFYETLSTKNGKLQRRQLWRDSYVDPMTLQFARPQTEEKEVYEDSEQ